MSWDKCEKKIKEIRKTAREINHLIDDLSKKMVLLSDLLNVAYQEAEKKDTQFFSSPIGPSQVMSYFKQHMVKNKLKVGSTYIRDAGNIKTFEMNIQEATDWLLKLKEVDDERRTNSGQPATAEQPTV